MPQPRFKPPNMLLHICDLLQQVAHHLYAFNIQVEFLVPAGKALELRQLIVWDQGFRLGLVYFDEPALEQRVYKRLIGVMVHTIFPYTNEFCRHALFFCGICQFLE